MSSRRAIMLVARREIRERLRSKVFVSTLVMLLIVGGSTALQGALEGADVSRRRHRTGARRPCGCAPTRGRAFDDAKVHLRAVASPAVGRRALESEHVDALLLLSQDRLVFRTNVDASSSDRGLRSPRSPQSAAAVT